MTPVCKLINSFQDPEKNIADGTHLWMNLKLEKNYDKLVQERISKAISDVCYAANYMHPAYKGLKLDEDQVTVAKNFMNRKLDDQGKQEMEDFIEDRNQPDDLAEHCAKDPISYWGIKEFTWPKLAKLCKKIFLFPASTALLEGYFSHWTYIHNKYRNRLGDTKSAVLADSYHLLNHFRTGRWENTVDKRHKKYIPMNDVNLEEENAIADEIDDLDVQMNEEDDAIDAIDNEYDEVDNIED